ncbi:MAG: uncharacterized protein QOJ39_266 [Candidatus Eremiobacteraeota bacterium]|nr:uncharacterized protein [Candidatus Eremiobacteraeota bacterium]MEA2718402.1 uncharacterized protein [Candidatus Eremiobacteraeota bacterium]
MDPRIALAGFIVGTITGLSGIGGSSLLAPVLILLLGVKPTMAVGTDLMYSVPTKLLAAFVHARQKTVDGRLTASLALGGVPGSLAGLAVFGVLRAHVAAATLQHVVRVAIGIAILGACVTMIALYALQRRERTAAAPRSEPPRWRAGAIGFTVGVLVAITSIGSGSVTLPLLLLAVPSLGIKRLIGSEIAFAAIIVPIAAAGHTGFGDVDWHITASLLAGSLPGVYLGSRLCTKIDERPLRAVILVILAYAAYRLL